MLARLMPAGGETAIVFAGSAQTDLLRVAAQEARIARERLIGSAPEALAAAVRAMVALEAQCAPADISLNVLGVPPAALVVPWSEAAIAGYGLERVLTQVQLARIEAHLARLWPPGPFALGLAAARVVEAIVWSSRKTLSVLTVLDREFGARGRVGILPALLGGRGIVSTRVPTLNTRERVRVENALGA
jgi:malate/lactate dehydrogenase